MGNLRFIISGGGTGGHIFPAISIANALKKKHPDADFLFVGAEGRMEMEKVPNAGYKIVGLPVSGFDRSNLFRNFKVLFRLFKSISMAKKIVKDFKPDVVIGVGGYASGPTLYAAHKLGVPILLQEQNSYAGITNKLLAKKASRVCVAYDNLDRFFPKDKIVLTGNPVRQDFLEIEPYAEEAYGYFGFKPGKKTLLIVGGSLGARTINQSVIKGLGLLRESGIQVIWQTGKLYYENARKEAESSTNPNLLVTDFVMRMDYAYAIADLVISRAGASSISELCLLKKASILVPSPNVSEDHQTKNAMALVEKEAAVMIPDKEAPDKMIPQALKMINDDAILNKLSLNAHQMAQLDSAGRIADEVLGLVKQIENK
jgi:UDP-N-acetylglucosamine--N-acetylmuramyl-(pentapeptide) pyrophosphoryl-undecaprenol N-acetylglucosamine transferase